MRFENAKIILPLPINKQFDYKIPKKADIKVGMRVLVDFNGKKTVGVVAQLTNRTEVSKLKYIIEPLENLPSLSEEHIRFAKFLSSRYLYSQNEFVFMMLPAYLKNTKRVELQSFSSTKQTLANPTKLFIKAEDFKKRYAVWKDVVANKLKDGSVLIIFPQISYLDSAYNIIKKDFSNPIKILHSQQTQKELFLNWKDSRQNSLILGTRVAIFYYPLDLVLIVVEEESSQYYFQEEKPYYYLQDIATLLADFKKIDLIFGSDYPSLATYKAIKDKKIEFTQIQSEEKKLTVIPIETKKVITPLFVELIKKNINENKKILIVWNKKGFARFLYCLNCGYQVGCKDCSSFLYLLKSTDTAICPYCLKTYNLSNLCPNCKTGYIKSVGLGIDKLEVILRKIFFEAKIENLQNADDSTQIILSTSKILSLFYQDKKFDVGFLLDADSYLSFPDYEATFRSFIYIKKLLYFVYDQLYIFTRNKNHYLFESLLDWQKFYEYELTLRKQFKLPPYYTVATLIIRGKSKNRLFKRVQTLYNKLATGKIEIYGPIEERPFKKRTKFYYKLILKSKSSKLLRKALYKHIEKFRTSSSFKIALIIRD